MRSTGSFFEIDETTRLRELLQQYPRAIKVLMERDVPISCAGGSIADAARACGVATADLLEDLLDGIRDGDSGIEAGPERIRPSHPISTEAESVEREDSSLPGSDRAGTADWHAVPIETTLELLRTEPEVGLSSDEAGRRLARFGPNTVPMPPNGRRRRPWWRSIRWGSPGWGDHGWRWEE